MLTLPLIALFMAVSGLDNLAAAFQIENEQQAVLTSITGAQFQARIVSIVDQQLVGPELPAGLQLSDLMMIQLANPVDDKKPAITVTLAQGGHLNARSVSYQDESFSVATDFGTFTINAVAIRGCKYEQAGRSPVFQKTLQNPSTEQDQVVAATPNGQQTVAGLLESINDEKVQFNFRGESRTISISKVVGLVVADLQPNPVQGVVALVTMIDGSRISGNITGLESGKLTIQIVGEQTLSVPWSAVSRISIRSERMVFLSDLDPVDEEQNALATLPFRWRRDRSVDGNPIRLQHLAPSQVRTYDKGLGTHAACRLEFANDQEFDRFAATVGIDAETGGNGDCDVSVWADGIQLWSAQISGRSEPVDVDVDIAGMKRVTLVVRNGAHLDLGDHVDWAEARFLKTK